MDTIFHVYKIMPISEIILFGAALATVIIMWRYNQ